VVFLVFLVFLFPVAKVIPRVLESFLGLLIDFIGYIICYIRTLV
jgi:hypothetical protein